MRRVARDAGALRAVGYLDVGMTTTTRLGGSSRIMRRVAVCADGVFWLHRGSQSCLFAVAAHARGRAVRDEAMPLVAVRAHRMIPIRGSPRLLVASRAGLLGVGRCGVGLMAVGAGLASDVRGMLGRAFCVTAGALVPDRGDAVVRTVAARAGDHHVVHDRRRLSLRLGMAIDAWERLLARGKAVADQAVRSLTRLAPMPLAHFFDMAAGALGAPRVLEPVAGEVVAFAASEVLLADVTLVFRALTKFSP